MANPVALQLIRDQKQKLLDQMSEIQAQVDDLADAERRLVNGSAAKGHVQITLPIKQLPLSDKPAPKGQAAQVLSVLLESPNVWMDQAAIGKSLEEKGTPIIPSSLQPVLSKLRREGLVAKNGKMLVAHPSRVRGVGSA